MESPRIHLAIDNCFASKRWPRPREWIEAAREAGLSCVEASADTECDPLYTVPQYLRDWADEVAAAEAAAGSKVVNLYSGHGTYATLGLCHHDPRVADHILRDWLLPMAGLAARLGAGLGFFCHAFAAGALRDRASHDAQMRALVDRLVELSGAAQRAGVAALSLEQMYSPNQPPWRIEESRDLMREVWQRGGAPLYITIDTGHQTGQKRFLRPGEREVERLVGLARAGERLPWTGHAAARAALERGAQGDAAGAAGRAARALDEHSYLMARPEDADPYAWLEALACWSPIIHLQQTSGDSSGHRAFTEEHNRDGIICAQRVLAAIAACYAGPPDPGMPPRCRDIHLTLELFFGPAETDDHILAQVRESVEYWRRFVPADGLTLDELKGRGW